MRAVVPRNLNTEERTPPRGCSRPGYPESEPRKPSARKEVKKAALDLTGWQVNTVLVQPVSSS